MVSELDVSVLLGATAITLVLLEWAFVWFKVGKPLITWINGAGSSIVSGVLQKMGALRTGRGKNPTAIETLAAAGAEDPETPTAVDPRAQIVAGALGDNIDPRALQEGLPLLQKLQAGQKLTAEETAKGMQILGHLANASKQQRAAAGASGSSAAGGFGGSSPESSGWA